jgi:mercuric ion binding protein
MKFTLTLITSLILTSSIAAASDTEQTAIFDVEKMTCATCPITVRKAMLPVDGIREVNVDLDSKTAVVSYDAELATPVEIGLASTDVGFPTSLRDAE